MNIDDRLLQEPNEAPPVHPHLIEHLRKKFPVTLYPADPRGGNYAEEQLCFHERQWGVAQVIDYLETLANSGQDETPKENPDELHRSEAESAGSDPRRPRTRERG